MNFEDESYVRIYTRKTLTHKLLGWEGRTVMRLMIDEFDAAGVFEIRGDAALCISAVTDLPIDIVRVGLARLLDTETWAVTARAVTWPTFEEAQNCCRSDRVRQRASRKARAARAVTDVTLAVTAETPPVTDVTKCHSPSPPPSLPSPLDLSLAGVASEQTEPPTHIRIPEGWNAPEELFAEAFAAGVTRAGLEEAVQYWRGRKLGGEWFTPEDFFRGKFAAIKIREEKSRFAEQQARSGSRQAPANELDTTGAATVFRVTDEHRQYALGKGLDWDAAAKEYRRGKACARLSTAEQERDFLNRLRCWAATGTFIADGSLPKPKKPPGRAGSQEAA